MNAEKLNQLFEEPAPASSIRKASPAPRSSQELTPGTVLADKYEVERRIGEGAMGIVFAARHLGLDETVAIKFVRPDVQDTAGAMARFAREAKLAARIHSEHVAKVFDVGVLEPFGPFIVMEYLEGTSLAELLEAEGPLPAQRLVGYLLQACEALAAAHAVGVVHRDVKPDNLFVTSRAGAEVVRLLDFGIAQVVSSGPVLESDAANGPAVVLGSPLYMAPEQLRPSSIVDARADIWALGVASYELLSGNMPFAGASLSEICASILDAEPPALGPSCPAELAAIVRRCLMKDPDARFATVADLAAALLPLAARDAHSYASRASSILRASSAMPAAALVAMRSEPSTASNAAPAVPPRARAESSRGRGVRFHSSALVASATILALAALGVVAALPRASGEDPVVATQAITTEVMAAAQPLAGASADNASADNASADNASADNASTDDAVTPAVGATPELPAAVASDPAANMTASEPAAPPAGEPAASLTSEPSPLTSQVSPADGISEPPAAEAPAMPPSADVAAANGVVAGVAPEPSEPAQRERVSRPEPARRERAKVRERRSAPAEARLLRQAVDRRRAASRVRLVEAPARPRLVEQKQPASGKRAR
jgi:serine/threonine-protein kinase